MILPFLLLVVVTAIQPQADELGDLIIGVGGCLAVAQDLKVDEGAEFVFLAADEKPLETAMLTRPPGEDSDCTRKWRGDAPVDSRLLRVQLPVPLDDAAVFALRRRPGLRVLGGPPTRLSADETRRWLRAAGPSLPPDWHRNDVLVHAYRYGAAGAGVAVELYLGRATLNPDGASPPIRSISIRRMFLIGDRVLASEEYERVSGREERAETEPPELTFDNWSASETERTVAFVSTDDGGSWRRLSTDIGFEGINWVSQELRDGLPAVRWYVYTPH